MKFIWLDDEKHMHALIKLNQELSSPWSKKQRWGRREQEEGRTLVPRWRMMMAPGLATWSPYILTPSLWPLESRPFFVLPAPFLCAIWMVSRRAGTGTPTAAPPTESAARSPRRKEGRKDDDGDARDRPLKAPASENAMDAMSGEGWRDWGNGCLRRRGGRWGDNGVCGRKGSGWSRGPLVDSKILGSDFLGIKDGPLRGIWSVFGP